mmetsp:Transcript_46118/g.94318  ORF Transcript_46118/g.94318 Transcript_46118/m.94318 type:complete len:299 (+) Transcript_46118:631-1527(+)
MDLRYRVRREHLLPRSVSGGEDAAVRRRAELVPRVARRKPHLLVVEVLEIVDHNKLTEEGIAEDHRLVRRLDALVEIHLVRVHLPVHVLRVVHEGVTLASHLLTREDPEGRGGEVALDVGVGEEQASGSRVELSDERLLHLGGLEVQQLDAAVRDGVDVDAVNVLASHGEHDRLFRHHLLVIPSQLQLTDLVVGCESKLARHRRSIACERLPMDVPARPVRLRERLEESSAAGLVSPAEPQDAIDIIEVPAVAVLDHAHACIHRVLAERRHVRGVIPAQVGVVEERHVHVVELDQVES